MKSIKKSLVLVVDNNASNAKLIKICLTNGGYQVLTAENAEEGLKILKDMHPDVVIIDVKLSDMDGLQLTQLLKENPATSDIIVLALTTHAWVNEEGKIRNAGCDGVILQPFDTRTLAQVVDSYIGRNRYEKHNV